MAAPSHGGGRVSKQKNRSNYGRRKNAEIFAVVRSGETFTGCPRSLLSRAYTKGERSTVSMVFCDATRRCFCFHTPLKHDATRRAKEKKKKKKQDREVAPPAAFKTDAPLLPCLYRGATQIERRCKVNSKQMSE